MTAVLRARTVEEIVRRRERTASAEALATAAPIVEAIKRDGESALRRYAERFGDLEPNQPIVLERPVLHKALSNLDRGDRERLERVVDRIRTFAEAQRAALLDVTVPIPGGAAGHRLLPAGRAGCYSPGGRYPLPSSVLMTVITARVAGVGAVIVASPKPPPLVLAAAAVADADAVVPVGGAQAIAALAYGAGPISACDVVVGPGNRYVTAAKQLVSHRVGIDTLAGPSELVVFADDSADPEIVAADLLAQAEHDPDALPLLVTLDATLAARVNAALARQLSDLPTASVARAALTNGGVIEVDSLEQGIAVCDAVAPEHLELHLSNAPAAATRLSHYGALFIGSMAAEVLGDYGAGPNHVLPTGGAARRTGGLSVLTFLRIRPWLRIDDGAAAGLLIEDAAWLAQSEGLEGHRRAVAKRRTEGARADGPAAPPRASVL